MPMLDPRVGRLDRSSGREGPLENGRAAHSSALAGRIPWTEEPGGPQSMGQKETQQKQLSTQHKLKTHMCLLRLMSEAQFIPVTWEKLKSWQLSMLKEELGDLTELSRSRNLGAGGAPRAELERTRVAVGQLRESGTCLSPAASRLDAIPQGSPG